MRFALRNPDDACTIRGTASLVSGGGHRLRVPAYSFG